MKDSDNRFTRLEDLLNFQKMIGVKFDLDPCADRRSPAWKHIANKYTERRDGLKKTWFGNVFLNPPFSDIEPWVFKALSELKNVESITFLLPANRTDQKWWQELWWEWNVATSMTMFGRRPYMKWLTPRVKFGTPEDPDGLRKKNHPPFACVLITLWGRKQ